MEGVRLGCGRTKRIMRRRRKRREVEVVCPFGSETLRWQSYDLGMEVGVGVHPGRHYGIQKRALEELSCVLVALWQVVEVC